MAHDGLSPDVADAVRLARRAADSDRRARAATSMVKAWIVDDKAAGAQVASQHVAVDIIFGMADVAAELMELLCRATGNDARVVLETYEAMRAAQFDSAMADVRVEFSVSGASDDLVAEAEGAARSADPGLWPR